jgi:hypothetical protein
VWRVKTHKATPETTKDEVRSVGSIQFKRICPLVSSSVVREINRINERELDFGAGGASWHDEYKGVL